MALNDVLNTSGDIPHFLARTMTEIRTGDLSVEKGMAIAALSKEITASMQTEVNVAKTRIAMLQTGKSLGDVTHMGKLIIDAGAPPALSGKQP